MIENHTLLVVDDEADVRQMMQDILMDQDYLVLTAESGEDALVFLEEKTGVDLILLDVSMPGLNGLEVLEIIKSNPSTNQIPVIMVTALDQISYKQRAYSLGADDFLAKPFELEELCLRVSTHIRLRDAIKAEKALNDQLKATNEDLQNFAYVVSHDLKTPIRGIASLAEWIDKDLTGLVSGEVAENLHLLKHRVSRLNNMIDGTLQYSKIGRIHETPEEVNISFLLDEIIDQINPPPHIKIQKSGLFPVIYAEKHRIEQVFKHLISNAVIYNDKTEGKIEISGKNISSGYCFEIHDNGPGINPQYFKKIFQIFQSLSHHDELEHTGIGLTITRKIIEMYGGKIWVESEPGVGTSFFFTLPGKILHASYRKG